MATSAEEAAQIYTASVLVVDPDTPAERDYLALLAQKMNVDPGLAAQVQAQTDALFPKA